jgi:tetratricopeptide (TPR) repeat protein
MDSGREHVRQHDWDRAAEKFAQVLDMLPPDFRGATHEMRFCIEMVQTPQVFDRLTNLRPSSRHLWYARGRAFASAREWDKAAADMKKALGLFQPLVSGGTAEPGPWRGWSGTQHELGSLLVLAGDETGYQELCRSLLDAQLPEDEIVFSCISRTCTMTPDAVADVARPLQWAHYAIAKRPRVAWYWFALGLAQHRACQHAEAVQSLKRSLAVNKKWVGRGQNYATLALACHSLGQDQEARRWLNHTKLWLNETNRAVAGWKFGMAASDFLSDWLCAQVLLREAEKQMAE